MTIKICKRIFAVFMVAVMCLSLMSSPAYAQDTTTISDTAKEAILKDAKSKTYWSDESVFGYTMNFGGFQVTAQESGKYSLQQDLPDNYLSGDVYIPELGGTLAEAMPGFKVYAYAAVLDTDANGNPLPNARVQYYYVDVDEEDKTISGTIPVGETGSAVMILQQLQIAGKMEFKPTEDSETVLENADIGQTVDYNVSYTMSDNLAFWMADMRSTINGSKKLYYTLTISLPAGMEINTSDYTFDSNIFECTEIEKVSEGQWLCNFKLKLGEWDYQDGQQIGIDEKDKLESRLKEPMTLAFSATIPPELTAGGQNLVGSMLLHGWYDSEVSWQQYDFRCQSTPAIIRTVSAVTITPADMTIYMGGDGGYDAVVGEDGEIESSTNSLPHPLFIVDMPKDSTDDPTKLTFTNGMSGEKEKNWTLVCANPDTDGQKYYYFKEGDGQEKVRVTYTDKDGKEHISDMFNPYEVNDVFTTYEIALYSGENNIGEIKAKANDGAEYAISANTGTLTVRAVEDTDPTSDIQSVAPTEPVVSGNAVAVAPAGTTYTLNNTGVPLPDIASDEKPDGSKPSLLFDSIIEDSEDSTARTDALKAQVDEKLGAVGSNTTRHYEVKYLDLVDANNGNAWITSSKGTDIYWGYPKGTDSSTTFKLVHFKGLHRDGENSGYDVSDIKNLAQSDIEEITVTNTENGIKFYVDAGGFSPFALVWEENTTPDPGPDPDPTPTPDPEEPELERGDHYAYIFGYEDNTIRPDNDITRAEVATIFYRLLTDASRDEYHTTDNDFTDVSADAWYNETVSTLANAGVLAGYEDGSFRPNAPITRAEYAAIATRFDDLAAGTSSFTDISGHWAEAAINAAYSAGWVGGYEDGTFRPDQNITRAEAMALINRVLERAVDSDGMLDDMQRWVDCHPDAWHYADVQEATNSHDYEREEGEKYETWTELLPNKVF